MSIEKAIMLADRVFLEHTGKHLSDLQAVILRQVLEKKKYLEIADFYGCTEGHVKDIASLLWKLLSEALGERVTKSNFRSVLERRLREGIIKINSAPTLNTDFLGRENAIANINSLIERGNKVIVIQGKGGVGKTTLAQHFFHEKGFDLVLELLMAKETQNIISIEGIIEEWLKKDFNEEPGREFGVTLIRLKRHLEKQKIGILIDNLEPALDRHGKLIDRHRRYVELLRILADIKVKSVALITSRDRLCEADLKIAHYRLPGLEESIWMQFFELRKIKFFPSTLKKLHKTYGGNAKAMGIVCGVIQEDFEADLDLYWQENKSEPLIETDLKNLVASQFDRLQNLDRDAYLLLCRLGCYRYQDLSKIPKAGLTILLWDIKPEQQQRLIQSLKNRSLIEYTKEQYWLHPDIKTEAVYRLKISEEWEKTNRIVAKYWTNSVQKIIVLTDAIAALEAYYHYIEIQNFEEAAKVILKSRDNQWGQFLPLGSTLYRLGLLQPVLSAITQIIDRVNYSSHLSELNSILGDIYWITGKIHQAITCQKNTISIATNCLTELKQLPSSQRGLSSENQHKLYYLKMLEVDALLSIGLYKIDLWELPEATDFFKQVIALTSDTPHHRWGEKAAVCLALVNSHLGLKQDAIALADSIYNKISSDRTSQQIGRFAYFIQILGQTYFKVGDSEKALLMYRQAIAFSEESHHTQVKAKALIGLAIIYRDRGNYPTAIAHHADSLIFLEQIGAKCDLAEALFQYGLTVKKQEKIELAIAQFKRAIQLFTEMEAPKQVEKVTQALKNNLAP
jgi:tetratricopeptide (TPR) repeat protein